MATPPLNTVPAGQTAPARVDKRVRVDLHNPTRATRGIYDGIEGSQKNIVVRPGETAANVEISETVAKELRARTRRRGQDKADLTVHEPGKGPQAQQDGAAAEPAADEDQDTED